MREGAGGGGKAGAEGVEYPLADVRKAMSKSPKIPKYRKHKASGQAAVVLSGVWFYLGPHGSAGSKELYERRVAEWLAAGAGRAVPAGAWLAVSGVLDAYEAHAAALVGESQLARIRSALGYARRLYGGERADRFGGKALKACRAAMLSTQNRRSANSLAGCLKRCWRWALSEEMVPAAAAQSVLAVAGLRRGEAGSREPDPVPPADPAAVEATLPHMPPHPRDMALVQLYSGMRPLEVCRLRGDELDTSDAELWVWRPRRHKTAHHGRPKQVFLGPRAVAVLAPYLEAAGGGYLFSPRRQREGRLAAMRAARKTPVQPSQRDRSSASPKAPPGERYTRAAYTNAVARACRKAGVEPWRPRQLRHLRATQVVKEYGWEVGRLILGHATINTTQIYAVQDMEKVREAVRETG
jgi:integrase